MPSRAATAPASSRKLLAIVIACATAAAVACADDKPQTSPTPNAADASPGGDASVVTRGSAPYTKLSETGLYRAIASKELAADLEMFQPAFVLWSDGAEKKRWIRLPPGAVIDASDPDRFILPVGTQLFKEFSKDGKRLETRLVERVAATGHDDTDYWAGAFVWRDDESDADFAKDGAHDVRGTAHDVPAAETCWSCHNGEPGHALGFSALQLSHELGGLNLAALRQRGLVPASVVDRTLPGDPIARAGVGWLHANCGHCHNPHGTSWPDTNMMLRFGYGESSIESSELYKSTAGVATRTFPSVPLRIDPGNPDTSAIVHRLSTRGSRAQMPPIATEFVDPNGTERVRAWVSALPKLDAGQ
jgi:hypothetical protein